MLTPPLSSARAQPGEEKCFQIGAQPETVNAKDLTLDCVV